MMEVSVTKHNVYDQNGNVIMCNGANKLIETEPRVPITPNNYAPKYILGRALYNYIIKYVLDKPAQKNKDIMSAISPIPCRDYKSINISSYAMELYECKGTNFTDLLDILVMELHSLIKDYESNSSMSYEQIKADLYSYYSIQKK